MSSEGSISNGSRIRQFGLYRSIDSRTEEFLRLSRRRQIRQGCACAAVSTAITVTVVVVVFFVYEFSFKSEMSIEDTLRTNWFSFINDTSDDGFQTKYSKSQIDIKTLTLLPILLKALQKNAFLKQIFEEQSRSSPDNEDIPEYTSDKNSFTQNWFRNPSSKLYSIVFKTTPIVYYSSPKNLEYFRKVTKLRDYQRIRAYVDKMIKERVYIGSTRPTIKEKKSEYPRTKLEPAQVEFENKKLGSRVRNFESKTKNRSRNCTCNCPEQNGSLLNKLLIGLEKLLSSVNNTNKNITSHCAKDIKLKRRPLDILTIPPKTATKQQIEKPDSKKDTFTLKPIEMTKSYENVLPFKGSTVIFDDEIDAKNTVQRFFFKPVTNNTYFSNKLSQQPISNVMQQILLSKYKQPILPIEENDFDENFYKTDIDDNYMNNQFDIMNSQRDNQIKVQDLLDIQTSERNIIKSAFRNTDFSRKRINSDRLFNLFKKRNKMIVINPYKPMQITSSEPSFMPSSTFIEFKHNKLNDALTDKPIREKNKKIRLKAIETSKDQPNPLEKDAQMKQELTYVPKIMPLHKMNEERTEIPLLLFSARNLFFEEKKQARLKPKVTTTDTLLHGQNMKIAPNSIIATAYKEQSEQKLLYTYNVSKLVKPIVTDKLLLKEDTQMKPMPILISTEIPLVHKKDKQKNLKQNNNFQNISMHHNDKQENLLTIIATAFENLHKDKHITLTPLIPMTGVASIKENEQTEKLAIINTTYKDLIDIKTYGDNVKERLKPIIITIDHLHEKSIPTSNRSLLNHDKQDKLNTYELLRRTDKKINLNTVVAITAKPLYEEEVQAISKPHQYILNEIMNEEDIIQEERIMEPIITNADELLSEEDRIIHSKQTKHTTKKPLRSSSLPAEKIYEVIVENYAKQSTDGVLREDALQNHIKNFKGSKQTNFLNAVNPELAWKELESEHLSALEALILPNSQINNESDSIQKDQIQDYDFNIINYFDISD